MFAQSLSNGTKLEARLDFGKMAVVVAQTPEVTTAATPPAPQIVIPLKDLRDMVKAVKEIAKNLT